MGTLSTMLATITHLEWTDFDMHILEGILSDWEKRDFRGNLNLSTLGQGYLSITTANWHPSESPFVIMEVHKLRGNKRFWGGIKSRWVIRIQSCESYNGAFPIMHGCVDGPNMVMALDRAILDIGYGFSSTTRLEQYFASGCAS